LLEPLVGERLPTKKTRSYGPGLGCQDELQIRE